MEEALYLAHHGILGQKWGIRRFQNPDGSLTDAGKRKRGIGDGTSAKKKAKPDSKIKAAVKKNFKENYYDPKVKEYQDMGYSKKEATDLADKRYAKMKKIAIGTGVALGVGAVAAGALYYGRNYADYTIKKGITLQTLTRDTDRLSKGSHFYTNYLKADKILYEGMFGGKGNSLKYKMQMPVNKEIKIAANKSAEKVFNKTLNKNVISNAFNLAIQDAKTNGVSSAGEIRELEYARDYILGLKGTSGAGHNSIYKRYNRAMPVLDKHAYTKTLNESFNKALQKSGYSGILDVNDTSVSMLRGFRPTIITDKSVVDAASMSIKQLTDKEVTKGSIFGRKYSKTLIKLDNPAYGAIATIATGEYAGKASGAISDRKASKEIERRKLEEFRKKSVKNP